MRAQCAALPRNKTIHHRGTETQRNLFFLPGCMTPWLSCADHFTVTSVRVMVGYWWFHWAEMLSKVRRKGVVWPGASGATLRSTGSRKAPFGGITPSGGYSA